MAMPGSTRLYSNNLQFKGCPTFLFIYASSSQVCFEQMNEGDGSNPSREAQGLGTPARKTLNALN
jgi:hypothetical protein